MSRGRAKAGIAHSRFYQDGQKVLRAIEIENFKSIKKLRLDLGRINVFIGENGAGKSNILEALAFAGAAQAGKLDNEFLVSRGIRVTSSKFMRSAFKLNDQSDIIIRLFGSNNIESTLNISNDGLPYSQWHCNTHINPLNSATFFPEFLENFKKLLDSLPLDKRRELLSSFQAAINSTDKTTKDSDGKIISRTVEFPEDLPYEEVNLFPAVDSALRDFVIYSPENSSLRVFEREGQIEPLGVNGEGLFKLLTVMKEREKKLYNEIKKRLKVFSWFSDFDVGGDTSIPSMVISDKFLPKEGNKFDQLSSNEGFLFLVFYLALFMSGLTPKFFAVDNIDASLNPKLCSKILEDLSAIAELRQKQVILTTHNPAILDGIDLRDDEQRLFIVHRDRSGATKAARYNKPLPEGYPRKMSELFLSGAVGGLPKGF